MLLLVAFVVLGGQLANANDDGDRFERDNEHRGSVDHAHGAKLDDQPQAGGSGSASQAGPDRNHADENPQAPQAVNNGPKPQVVNNNGAQAVGDGVQAVKNGAQNDQVQPKKNWSPYSFWDVLNYRKKKIKFKVYTLLTLTNTLL